MAKFKIQTYNEEMTELFSERHVEFSKTEDALIEAYDMRGNDYIIVLMRQSISDPKCWIRIAKFY